MKAFEKLPEDYAEYYCIDLQKDKKTALTVNLLAIVTAAALVLPMLFAVPISLLFSMEQGIGRYFLRFAVLLIGTIAYMVLHEFVHGLAMKICGTKKVKYGFTGMYAFAGSEDLYDKSAYIFIALAPVVLWGIVLAVVTPAASQEWFWVVYLIQVFNLSGAAGDLYVTVRILHFPQDILIQDHGVGMTVYAKNP